MPIDHSRPIALYVEYVYDDFSVLCYNDSGPVYVIRYSDNGEAIQAYEDQDRAEGYFNKLMEIRNESRRSGEIVKNLSP